MYQHHVRCLPPALSNSPSSRYSQIRSAHADRSKTSLFQSMNSEQWTNLFFSQHPPDWIHSVSENERSFKTFDHKRKWLLWRSAAEGRYATADRIQVLWLLVKSHQGYRRKYVAKVVSRSAETGFEYRIPTRLISGSSSLNIPKERHNYSLSVFHFHAPLRMCGMSLIRFSMRRVFSSALRSAVMLLKRPTFLVSRAWSPIWIIQSFGQGILTSEPLSWKPSGRIYPLDGSWRREMATSMSMLRHSAGDCEISSQN